MERADVVVIGAGVAGLAAARDLRAKGHRILLIEARDRIGGRIFTHVEPGVPVPIELGAEFIHGLAPETRRLLRDTSLLAWDIDGEFRRLRRGRFVRGALRGTTDDVLRRIDTDRPDESFSEFLARRPGGRRLARARRAARQFVQGFHAADPDEISAHALAPDREDPASDAVGRSGRVDGGYARLADSLARDLADAIRLRTVAEELSWEVGGVEVTAARSKRSLRFAARAALVTLPLGVLQAPSGETHALTFRPDPPSFRKALDLLAMGSARRVVFRFRELPWMEVPRLRSEKAIDRLSFLRIESGPFRVWWTAYPADWPLAVAWCGGPPASLARGDPEEVADLALRNLAHDLGVSRRRLASRVEAFWTHDWDADPCARGAYSYARVNGVNAPDLLAKPLQRTLFFAGEATEGSQLGTVEGAIASGRRAARQIDRALRRE